MGRTRTNGTAPKQKEFEEIGTTGHEIYGGRFYEAYNTKLVWPTCWESVYSDMYRADPEVTIWRNLVTALTGQQLPAYQLREMDEPPTDDDIAAVEFANQVLEDIDGGINKWYSSAMNKTPLLGWHGAEIVLGQRSENWKAPNNDPWQSRYNDGLVGIRRLSYRHYSSFFKWDMDDATGRLMGMVQLDPPNAEVTIPIDRLLHITYGDDDNPEGLATLEAMWRLEYILRGLEMVRGIGFEKTAGYLKFKAENELTDSDKAIIKRAARGVLTAQASNYLALPNGIEADIIDTTFGAAGALETSIQNMRVLKLTLLGAQFAAISTMTGSGSFAALSDSSSMFLLMFNSMAKGFIEQADRQLTKMLFDNPTNAAAFPNMTRLPKLTVPPIDKTIGLGELATFAKTMGEMMTLSDDDLIAIRTKSGILSEALPEVEEDETGAAMTAPDETVTPLNGAQLTGALSVLERVQTGVLTAKQATEFLIAAGMSPAQVKKIVSEIGKTKPPSDAPTPEDGTTPPPTEMRRVIDNWHTLFDLATPEEDNEADDYQAALLALVALARADSITRRDFIAQMTALVEEHAEAMFRISAGLSPGDDMTEDMIRVFNDELQAHTDRVLPFANNIYAEIDSEAQTTSRVTIWRDKLIGFTAIGVMFNEAITELVWRLGATEEHCATCLAQNGTVRTRAEWLILALDEGIKPQSRDLECGGWHCDCSLEEVG